MYRLVVLVIFFALTFAAPASAERWQIRVDNDRVRTRLDLDGFKRNGELLTYRMDMTFSETSKRAGQRVISTSVIDCRANRRKQLTSETHFPDGTVRKVLGGPNWHDLKDWEFGAGVRNEHCDKVN